MELVKAQVCEGLHKLPSEVENEPADLLLKTLHILSLYNSNYNPRAHDAGDGGFEKYDELFGQ